MKKIFKIVAIVVIILIIGILTLFCIKVDKISMIERIREKIVKTEEIQTANEITIVDVTYLENNKTIEHEHNFKTIYDENKHWEECTICKEKQKEEIHNYSRTWLLGYESCNQSNRYTDTCKCGYSKTLKKPCTWNGKYYTTPNGIGGYTHSKACVNCPFVSGSYYSGGKLITINQTNPNLQEEFEYCHLSNGTILDCNHPGTCVVCKRNLSGQHSIKCLIKSGEKTGKVYCKICNTEFGEIERIEVKKDNNVPSTNIAIYKIITNENGIFSKLYPAVPDLHYTNTMRILENIENQVTIESVAIFKNNVEAGYHFPFSFYMKVNGKDNYSYIEDEDNWMIYPDYISPTITNITLDGKQELTEWSRTKPIIINGIENYCSIVDIKIVDEQENTIFEGSANVIDGKYSISCIPEIECDTNGRKFKIFVKDTSENILEQEFQIAKLDNIPPTPTSGTEILGDWEKSKNFTFTATDYGIGDVQVAFNDIKDLKLANVNENIYSRDYKFTGDVYQPKQLSVMYKDGLGNISMQKITIDKIDNTAPTITNADLHNSTITITSNDEHEKLGEGSGVVKYRYLASEEKLENPVVTKENSTEVSKTEAIKIKEIYKKKYVYAVAEDYVGNISEVYEFKVPELKLTAIANPNTSNGKGEIILDWSSYDVTDKYFVVYRKKENQEYWEKIVPLEQKLTGNTYIDTLANDEEDPNTPSITITENTENNDINITSTTIDNGSKYTYYIEAYDSTGELLSKSN